MVLRRMRRRRGRRGLGRDRDLGRDRHLGRDLCFQIDFSHNKYTLILFLHDLCAGTDVYIVYLALWRELDTNRMHVLRILYISLFFNI